MNSISINGKSSIGKHIRPFVSKLKAPVIAAAMALTPAAVCSAQSVNDSLNRAENTKETVIDEKNSAKFDVAARTFQFLNGANMSGISAGVSKNWENLTGHGDNLSCYGMLLGGYNFGSKLPTGVAMGYLDWKYPNQNGNINLSAEAYCEAALAKEGSYVKPAITPFKLNMTSGRCYFGIDPRLAFNIAPGQVKPTIEILTTISGRICKDLSAYIIGQCYNVSQPKDPSNYSINVGVIKNF